MGPEGRLGLVCTSRGGWESEEDRYLCPLVLSDFGVD